MVQFPLFPSPFETDYQAYVDHVRTYNEVLQARVKQSLRQYFELTVPQHVVVATTGSDGRFEKGPQSRIEMICLHEDGYSPDNERALLDQISRIHEGVFDEAVEFKASDDETRLVSAYEHNGALFVTRMMDAQPLYGNSDVLVEAKMRLEDEISDPDASKQILSFMDNQRSNALRITKTGASKYKGVHRVHFDVDAGTSFYNDSHRDDGCEGSFKYGPLRLVQYKLATDIVRAYRNGAPLSGLAVEDIPSHIPSRIDWMMAADVSELTKKEAADIRDSYAFFLWLYHQSQDEFRHRGNDSSGFNPEDVRERLSDLQAIVKKPWCKTTA